MKTQSPNEFELFQPSENTYRDLQRYCIERGLQVPRPGTYRFNLWYPYGKETLWFETQRSDFINLPIK